MSKGLPFGYSGIVLVITTSWKYIIEIKFTNIFTLKFTATKIFAPKLTGTA
jgi:hypothetical protein